MVLDVEVLIPETLRRMYIVSKKEVHPNARHGLFSRLFGDFQLIKGFDFVEDAEQVSVPLWKYLFLYSTFNKNDKSLTVDVIV